ncbi:PilZ domain-containing protein [Thalassolituus sp. LLYu03]|uniref:PilZ domain-containing protein n=1 Tax=Thalassolituus sp. LLYu03 TaxID=3421656 RepID=UPI003D2D1F61
MEERRRFFRLDDEVVMDFRAITQEEFANWKEHQTLQKSELKGLEQEIGALLHQLRSQHPTLGHLMELFNRKINLLIGDSEAHPELALSSTEARVRVNLSACGMAFSTNVDLSKQSHLLFNLQLKPSNAVLALAGNIIGVEKVPDPENPWLVRVNFEDLKEAEQELLIQHLFQLQSRTLRHLRDH